MNRYFFLAAWALVAVCPWAQAAWLEPHAPTPPAQVAVVHEAEGPRAVMRGTRSLWLNVGDPVFEHDLVIPAHHRADNVVLAYPDGCVVVAPIAALERASPCSWDAKRQRQEAKRAQKADQRFQKMEARNGRG